MRSVDVVAVAVACAVACGGSSSQPLYPAGSDRDEGHGLLARASTRMLTEDEDAVATAAAPRRAMRVVDEGFEYGGALYGGDAYGGPNDAAYGGQTYAGYVVPPWPYPSVNRIPTYTFKQDLHGAIEGTITWRGPTPTLTTACGAITPVRTGPSRALAGAVVYLERVAVGRTPMYASGEMRPVTVGGVVVKRGCAFAPAVQLVTPVPAQVSVHGDRKAARIVATLPGGAKRTTELQEGGRWALPMKAGVLSIAADDGTLGAAFVLGLETPAYAVTDEAGRFRLDELAPGAYELVVWHPPVPKVIEGKLVYGEPLVTRRSVRLDRERTLHVDVAIGPAK